MKIDWKLLTNDEKSMEYQCKSMTRLYSGRWFGECHNERYQSLLHWHCHVCLWTAGAPLLSLSPCWNVGILGVGMLRWESLEAYDIERCYGLPLEGLRAYCNICVFWRYSLVISMKVDVEWRHIDGSIPEANLVQFHRVAARVDIWIWRASTA